MNILSEISERARERERKIIECEKSRFIKVGRIEFFDLKPRRKMTMYNDNNEWIGEYDAWEEIPDEILDQLYGIKGSTILNGQEQHENVLFPQFLED